MRIVAYDNPAEFSQRIRPALLEREAENNLMLGISGRLVQQDLPDGLLMRAIEAEGRVIAAVVMTPPHKLVLTRMPPESAAALAENLHRLGLKIPGVVGPSETSQAFARAWSSRAGVALERAVSLRIYQLNQVNAIPSVPGSLRVPAGGERELLLQWQHDFGIEIGEPHHDVAEMLDRRLAEGSLYLWDDGGAVSMAGWAGPTPNGVRINAVYTPKALRKRGYATACVAALSQKLLDSGRSFCFLFTDLSNPTSNSIYQKIGYRPVCDCEAFNFMSPAPMSR